jgi:predicted RNA-binding protein with RPS1 domain
MILPGTVSSIVDFGAFVDLGGIDGLVHISELSWSHVNHPSEVVAVGDKVEVQVLDVDLSRERISLGLKQTQEDPWKQLVKDFTVGVIVDGKVTKIVPFGAFVEIGDNVEGLVHISEMARGHVEKPEDVVRVGDEIKVKVMDVDLDRRRISLSIRAANEELGLPDAIPAPSEDDEDVADEATETTEATETVETEAVETVEAEAEAGKVVLARRAGCQHTVHRIAGERQAAESTRLRRQTVSDRARHSLDVILGTAKHLIQPPGVLRRQAEFQTADIPGYPRVQALEDVHAIGACDIDQARRNQISGRIA